MKRSIYKTVSLIESLMDGLINDCLHSQEKTFKAISKTQRIIKATVDQFPYPFILPEEILFALRNVALLCLHTMYFKKLCTRPEMVLD